MKSKQTSPAASALIDREASARLFAQIGDIADLFGTWVSGIVSNGVLNSRQKQFAASAMVAAEGLRSLARKEASRHVRAARAKGK